MPESDSENDIWEYKPLRKTKRPKKRPASSHCAPARGAARGRASGCAASPAAVCPSCQMPFRILLGQSPQWHVSECLEVSGPKDECPDGLSCSSTIPSHYRKYSHSQLAHCRAAGDEGVASLGGLLEDMPSTSSPTPSPSKQSRPDLPVAHASSNALMCLRSPTVKDIQKKKGWSPSVRGGKTASRQGGDTSTPSKASRVCDAPVVTPSSLESAHHSSGSDDISYSPISSLPTDVEVVSSRKVLFSSDMTGIKDEDKDSLIQHDSDDDRLAELLAQQEQDSKVLAETHLQDQGRLVNSLTPANYLPAGTTDAGGSHESNAPVLNLKEEGMVSEDPDWCSPQSLVLENLRDHLLSRAEWSSQDNGGEEALELPQGLNRIGDMAPRKTQVKPASSTLKQTDIGVFFGLKPLKKEEPKPQPEVTPAVENIQQVTPILAGGRCAGDRRKRKASHSLGDPDAAAQAAESDTVPMAKADRARRPWRKRWARGRASEDDTERVKRCPFYKKIPGTGFVVDAFQYGLIDGITCYFLSHFHSDHYGGLTKHSRLPIYCNKITGNLVKTKLRVEEQYIHILPMNTEVFVEGVRVLLLDANHCPGAAMLLFLLADGQTILHTGDFRANPSMERYPELQGCRVQTVYLDTTYCSPEYAFPPQQEVITFAVNVAFEYVTLHPCTLVVCGAYAVGKEKVFLALAEVLGCKVGMSRDKFLTMSCLESEQVSRLVTTDWRSARVHVLPMGQVNVKGLQTHLRKFSGTYNKVLAFKPTGWTFSSQAAGLEDIQPVVRDNITVYEIPYSEHSSYVELKRFIQWLKPKKIIPTVNAGSWASRKPMEQMFSGWMAELVAGGGRSGTRVGGVNPETGQH
nr:DNA cross-link repair 1A protein [Paramormyrops kingsleyae]